MDVVVAYFKVLFLAGLIVGVPAKIRTRHLPNIGWSLPSAIAEGSRDGSIPLIFSWIHTLHFPKFDQCQML